MLIKCRYTFHCCSCNLKWHVKFCCKCVESLRNPPGNVSFYFKTFVNVLKCYQNCSYKRRLQVVSSLQRFATKHWKTHNLSKNLLWPRWIKIQGIHCTCNSRYINILVFSYINDLEDVHWIKGASSMQFSILYTNNQNQGLTL